MAIYILVSAALLASAGCGRDDTVLLPAVPDTIAAPVLTITYPPYESGIPRYLDVTRFSWLQAGERPPSDIRYFATMLVDTTGEYNTAFDMLGDINENPGRYDTLWSDWVPYDSGNGSGRTAVVGDDGSLTRGRRHWFFVQGRDAEGNITEGFERETNARLFSVVYSRGPVLYLSERTLANYMFQGTSFRPEERTLPPGISLSFYWQGNAEQYSSEIVGYRYGWDVVSLEDWDAPFDISVTRSVPVTFYAGVHTLTVETADLAGNITRARIQIEIVPWPMDRALLLVDDFYGSPYPVSNLLSPSETEHDEFWESICSRADGFDAATDIYDTYSWSRAPSMELIGRYRNMVWTYSVESSNRWSRVVEFTPESAMDFSRDETPNLISIFLQKGGHVWTSGRSDQGGGLAAVLQEDARIFPVDIRCEITGPGSGCDDRSGLESLPYRDYCVTVIDKIAGHFRTDGTMPSRSLDHHDVLRSAFLDTNDPETAGWSGLPGHLELRDEVTGEGSFFCTDSTCSPGGFTYVEVYDPHYWLSRTASVSRNCFHPLYRMRAASSASVLDGQPVAIWITRYGDVIPGAPAAPSVHFGLPLWYFRHESVEAIADAVFERWGL
jgi:hypothetical protein